MKDLQKQLVAEPADWTQAVKTPASEPTAFILSPGKSSYSSADPSKALVNNPDTLVPAPTTAPSEASVPDLGNQTDYFCARLELAKTEGFLGIHSDATISYAIKASESDDSDKRELAAYLFSFIRTPEATKDLKGLAADTNPVVAEVANERLSAQSEDLNHYAVNYEPDNSLARIAPSHSSH